MICSILEDADLDRDGQISFEEFVMAMQKYVSGSTISGSSTRSLVAA